jgi:glycosyltransferase involved in cell wall biosynthesis
LSKQRILIVGTFTSDKQAPVTQASELAKILKANGYKVLTVSKQKNKLLKLINIVTTILLNKNTFDVGIVQFYSGNSFIWQSIACRLIKSLGKKLVITIHGGGVPVAIKQQPNKYLSVLRKADTITCPSTFMINELEQYGIKPLLIENSIPVDDYPFQNKKQFSPSLLWMRAFSPIYNPAMAVEVVRELKKTHPEVKLYMGGPDLGELDKTKQLVKEYRLETNIEFPGFMDIEKKKEYTGKADIFISTNRVDNAPVTIVEMWALGLPVVTTNVGGLPYMVKDGENSLLVDDNDAIAMTEKIKNLVSSPALVQKLVQNGRSQVANHSEEIVYQKWDILLNNL